MNYRNIPHFADGLMTASVGRGKAPHTSLLVAENVRTHTGDAVPRDGQKYLDASVSIPETINALYQYTREYFSLGETKFYTEYVFAAGTKLYSWEGPGNDTVWWLNEDYPLQSDDVWLATYQDWAYISDGIGQLMKYDAQHYYGVGIDAPAAAPTVVRSAVDQTDIPNGYRKYKYRYVRRALDGSGNIIDYIASPFSAEATSPNFLMKQMAVTMVASADPQVTHIELYCTLAQDSVEELAGQSFYLLEGVLPNANQTYLDHISNSSVENEHTAEDTTEDWTHPPDGLKYLVYYKDRIYGVPKDDPSTLRYCRLGEPEQWPVDNWLDVRRDDGDTITGIAVRGNTLTMFKNRSIWALTGDPAAVPIMQIVTGGESTASYTEFGLGCTAPRSLASYGNDVLIFYSKVYGVYMIAAGTLVHLSKSIEGIQGLDGAISGAVWVDGYGQPFYVLSLPNLGGRICNVPSRKWVSDSNLDVSCFCVDNNGYLLGGKGGRINRYYDPTATDDNGAAFTCKIRPNWLNLRDGERDASVRGIQVQANNLSECTVTLYNDSGQSEQATLAAGGRVVGFPGIDGRLFSPLFEWTSGNIESLTFLFLRRRRH